tara:strand:+ start:1307 stop:1456 length:150 start_codon:yes stop_codon:yes gene_type:complete
MALCDDNGCEIWAQDFIKRRPVLANASVAAFGAFVAVAITTRIKQQGGF